jgi:splicing factor 3A subunit 1
MYIEPTVGVIIPPPELRNIVDKTASFVARNGPEFESRIQNNEQNNPKFNFLRAGDPYNAYYQQKVKQIREQSAVTDVGVSLVSSEAPEVTGNSINVADKESHVESRVPDKIKQFMEKVSLPLEAPPDPEFMAEPPSSCALELHVLRLTARYVAVHGRSLLTTLMQREQRNPLFDFLRPTHNGFSYLTRMIEQYSKVLQPDERMLRNLQPDLQPHKLLQRLHRHVEWAKVQEAQQKKDAEAAERERQQYAQIDWHDFVIVETVDYQPGEVGIFPPPTTPEQVGVRIAAQQRIESAETSKDARAKDNADEDDDEDIDEDGSNDAMQADRSDSDRQTMPPPAALPPLPSSLDNVLIRKDYDPKAARRSTAGSAAPTSDGSRKDNWVISPITNERIPAEKLAEHMRYGLLDPRWVEERERAVAEKMQQEEVFAPGVAIESSLKQLAERRTDIFGSGDAETEIGKKIGEQGDQRSREKVTWDGYTSSAEATRKAARANITIEDQIQQIHRMKGLVDDDGKDRIGPSVPSSLSAGPPSDMNPPMSSNSVISSGPTMASSNRMQSQMHSMSSMESMMAGHHSHMQAHPSLSNIHGAPHGFAQHGGHSMHPGHPGHPFGHPGMTGHPGHPVHHQSHQGPPPFMMPPNPMLGMFSMSGPPPMPPMVSGPPGGSLNFNVAPPMSIPTDSINLPTDDEPAAKRMRSEDNLIPEDEFLATHSGSVTLCVQCPSQPDKPDLRLHGQRLTVTLNLTDMVSALKSAIHEQTNLVSSKQKLQLDGIFIKDNNTLAFYNVTDGCPVTLALKERGGRKK